MYSVLKSQKRKFKHSQLAPVTTATFLNNHHLVFTFHNATYAIINIHSEHEQLSTGSFPTQHPISKGQRIGNNKCIFVSQHCRQIFFFHLAGGKEVEIKKIDGGLFSRIMNQNPQSELLNSIGCESTLYGFHNGCFAIRHYLFEDRKVVIDWFDKNQKWKVFTQQIDIQVTGTYNIDLCNRNEGQIAIYKEQEVPEALWKIVIAKPLSSQFEKQIEIILPSNVFHEEILVKQIIKWLNNSYLILCLHDGQWKTFIADPQYNPPIQPYVNFQFLNQNPFLKEIYFTDYEKEIFYAITYEHSRIDGELYENGLILGSMKTGQSIERGYCTLKNIDISDDGRYILDVPSEMQTDGQIFFHLRLLLSKKSLYLFLIDNCELQKETDLFKEQIVKLL